jgi:septation ring formation regulator EzrA
MGNQSNNIDQIRSLIFGQQMDEYERRFNELSQHLVSFKEEFHNVIAKIEEKINALAGEQKQDQQALQHELQTTREQFGNALAATEQRLKEMIQELDGSSAKRLQLATLLETMGQQLRVGGTGDFKAETASSEQNER